MIQRVDLFRKQFSLYILLIHGCSPYTVTSVGSSRCVISLLHHVYYQLKFFWNSCSLMISTVIIMHVPVAVITPRTEEKLPNCWSAKLRDTCVRWINWKGDSRLRCIGWYYLVQMNGSHWLPSPLYMTCQNGEVLSILICNSCMHMHCYVKR